MFGLFKTREERAAEYKIPPVPQITMPEPEPQTCYWIGPTDNNRISFKMGYSTMTMNAAGCASLIEMLTVAMNQLQVEEGEQE
jgi:hypothetical protein